MTMVNELNANGCTRGDLKYLLLLLNPFAPHITEELWENLGFAAQTGKMCCQAEWPVADESKTVASTVELAVQVNGKLKGKMCIRDSPGGQPAGGQQMGDRHGGPQHLQPAGPGEALRCASGGAAASGDRRGSMKQSESRGSDISQGAKSLPCEV